MVEIDEIKAVCFWYPILRNSNKIGKNNHPEWAHKTKVCKAQNKSMQSIHVVSIVHWFVGLYPFYRKLCVFFHISLLLLCGQRFRFDALCFDLPEGILLLFPAPSVCAIHAISHTVFRSRARILYMCAVYVYGVHVEFFENVRTWMCVCVCLCSASWWGTLFHR